MLGGGRQLLRLEDVLRGLIDARLSHPVDPSISFAGVTHDSRMVQAGDLFVALRGQRDGHDFIPDAYKRGARGVLAERKVQMEGWLPIEARDSFAYVVVTESLKALQELSAYWLRQHPLKVVGVTGSVGKTTTKELVAAVLCQRFAVLKSESNQNNEIGLPLSLLRLKPEHRRAVLEMGMYAVGEIADLCRIAPPSVGVVTNVGPSHLERLGTIERIAQAKSELIDALPASGWAVLNGDDLLVSAMASRTSARSILYGCGPRCDVRATEVTSRGLSGIAFTMQYESTKMPMVCPTPGRHNVYSCLAATAVGLVDGLTWEEIQRGLSSGAEHVRIFAIPGSNGSTIIDDTYNASPISVIAALDLLAELPGRRIAILADMVELGDYAEEGHREVGAHAAASVDKLIVVGEQAAWIGVQALASGLGDVTFAEKREEVTVDLRPDDYVLVKGSRLMQMDEVVQRLRRHEGACYDAG